VAHDEEIWPHRVQCRGGVDQRFALRDRRALHAHVHNVSAHALAGEFERTLRSCGILEEKIDQRPATQRVELLDLLIQKRRELLGPIQQIFGLETIQVGYGQKVFLTKTNGPGVLIVFLHASRSLSHARLLSAMAASPQARRH